MNLKRHTYAAWDAVKDFHSLNGAVINLEPPDKPLGMAVGILRSRLILEELGETIIALHEENLILAADGLADLKYVVLGTGVTFGIPIQDSFLPPEGSLTGQVDPLHLTNFILASAQACTMIFAGMKRCCLCCNCDDPECGARQVNVVDFELMAKPLRVFDRLIGSYAATLGLPFEEVFWEVHRANLSKKLGGTKPGEKYAEGGGKGEGYTPPDVAGILNRSKSSTNPSPVAE